MAFAITAGTSKHDLARALASSKESRTVEFKQSFDPAKVGDWCELLKDIFAIANSGGGVIVFGVDNGGKPTGKDVKAIAALDPAKITDKVYGFTAVQFDDFSVVATTKSGANVVCLIIGAADVLLIPHRPGTYPAADGKNQERAFSSGVLYVRHGAKSEAATSADLARIMEGRIDQAQKMVLRNVRRIVKAPLGSTVEVIAPVRASGGLGPAAVRATTDKGAMPIRLTNEKNAPAYHLVDPDETHPLRMKELLSGLNKQLSMKISQYDVHAISEVHGCFARIEFAHKGKFGPRQYSPEFLTWLVAQLKKKPDFHRLAKSTLRRRRRLG